MFQTQLLYKQLQGEFYSESTMYMVLVTLQ